MSSEDLLLRRKNEARVLRFRALSNLERERPYGTKDRKMAKNNHKSELSGGDSSTDGAMGAGAVRQRRRSYHVSLRKRHRALRSGATAPIYKGTNAYTENWQAWFPTQSTAS